MTFLKSFYNQAKENKAFSVLSVVIFLLFLAMYLTELSTNKLEYNDFQVFYSAAKNYLENKPVYGVSFGLDTGYYKYSPAILLLFSPMVLLPFKIAGSVYFFINVTLLITLFYHFIKLIESNISLDKKKNIVFLLLFFTTFTGHFIRELHLGNTNLTLLFLGVIILKTQIKGKYIFTGFLFSILIFTKPYFIILGLPLLMIKDYSSIFSTLIWSCVFLILSLFHIGFKGGFIMYWDWIHSVLAHSNYLTSNNTLINIVNKLFKIDIPSIAGIAGYIVVSGLLFLFFRLQLKKYPKLKTHFFILYFFTLTALFPNFMITDTEHFMFSFGIIGLLAFMIFEKGNYWLWIPYLILLPFYLGEMNVILPKDMAENIKLAGGMGLANLIFIIWSFSSSMRYFKLKVKVNYEFDLFP